MPTSTDEWNEQDLTAEDLERLERESHGFRVLKFRNYRLFFVGNLISTTGFWMQSLAQSWLVVETLKASPFELGLVPIFQFGPSLILGIPAGALIDRFPKRTILLVTQFISMILAITLAILTFTDTVQLWHVYALGLGMGMVGALDMPSRQAFVSELVPKYALRTAIAINSATFNLGRILGPAIAGVVLAWFGAAMCFLINGLSYLGPQIAMLMMVLSPYIKRAVGSGWQQMMEGIGYVRASEAIRRPIIMIMVVGSFGMAYNVWLPLLATESFKADERVFGIMFSAMGIGSFLGALSVAFSRGAPSRVRMLIAAAALGLVTCSIGLIGDFGLHVWLATAFLAGSGFCAANTMALANTIVQTSSSDELRGRVMAVYSTVFMGTMPLAGLTAGTIANRWGVEASMYVGGGIVAIVALAFLYAQRAEPELATSSPIPVG